MLQPKRVKHRKQFRGKMRGDSHRGASVDFGEFGLKAMETEWITANQIEAARRAITHHIKRGGQIWIRVFPDKSVTGKPLETRQGGGKGAVDHWVAVVRRGKVMFEVGGITGELAKEALGRAAAKLPIRTKIVSKEEVATPV